jgi:phosphopantothenoylcysteine synthetase/decarboxylase
MKILVTAGNTLVPIDRVRCLTNVFTGRTGATIALEARQRGHDVVLLTSHTEAVADMAASVDVQQGWSLLRYQTFDELRGLLTAQVSGPGLDALVHCAAVSDYLSAGVYAPAAQTHFDPDTGRWLSDSSSGPALVDRSAGKVKSDEPELWLRLVRAPKLIDLVRTPWGFGGVLVKFKLEVGLDDAALLEVAEHSRKHSAADLMVANTLESSGTHAFLGPLQGQYQRVARRRLAAALLEAIEQIQVHRRG